ncbi:hypothetical protein OIU77_004266 [Salix suchowensis]|uniref:Uncharacterized protein n=1 Tax=Salix suchowensis TaxID=1278906 RepID=A0ABQ9AU21_9ROSI|nr:hypothetical protein OIU77_004266 [Salix suchowensis]
MGTLTSCSFSTVNLKLCSDLGKDFRDRTQLKKWKKQSSLCFLCKGGISKREVFNFSKIRCFSANNNNNNHDSEKDVVDNGSDSENGDQFSNVKAASSEEKEERISNEFGSDKAQASVSSRPPTISPVGPAYNNFQVDSFKLMELLGPEKVDPADVKLIKDKLFGYSTFWVTKEESFGDLGEGILFLGNLRGTREDVFAKLLSRLAEATGDKYNLFMVEEPNSEAPDPRGGPRVSFGLLRKEVSEPGPTTLWQYVIALLLFLLTTGSSVELGIASQINRLPPEVVKYFTDPNAVEPPDMELLLPFVDSALPLAYGVLGDSFVS